jgi:predicted ATPase/DNA-binding SARP family transcriptional activator
MIFVHDDQVKLMLKITTLGGLNITLDDQPVASFVSRKADALLVYLVMHPREHPRETLGNLLWDDLSQTLALSYLRTVLSSLQKQLAPYLRVTRHSVSINPESDIWMDVIELDRAVEAARLQWDRRGDFTHNTASELEKALLLYQGNFLEGFYVRNCREFEDWMLLEQDRLRVGVLEAHLRLGAYHLWRRSNHPGIDHTLHALQIDPLSEAGHRQMMRLLAQSGQRSAALAQYETCREMLRKELEVSPDAETTALYEAILEGKEMPEDPRTITSTLPIISTPFVDRPVPLAQIVAQLDKPQCRLLTLTGPGGVGKTRLAMEAARLVQRDYRHGACFASFTGVREPGRILETIASALGVEFGGDFSSEEDVIDYLRHREVLLVLDNFEYVLENAEVLSHLLQKTTSLKILVTSRERLNLVEEWLYFVETMMLPSDDDAADAVNFPAVQLFIQTAQRMQPAFSADKELKSIIQICKTVGGMPLAIELAASWVRMLSCEQIAQEVQRGLEFLATSVRNVPERHRSMFAVFESSYNLLTAEEQRAFRQLCIFRGGFHQRAAAAITDTSIFVLSSLVDKSLLTSVDGRYTLHELLRQYAKVKLEAYPDEMKAVQRAHSAYYARYLNEREDKLARSLPNSKFEEVIHEIENIRLAWQFALDHALIHEVDLFLRPLFRLYDAQSNFKDAEALFDALVGKLSAHPESDFVISKARAFQGACNFRMDQYESAEKLILLALPILEAYEARYEIWLSLTMLGRITAARGMYWQAQAYFSQIADMASEGDERAQALFRLASIATMLGQYEVAQQHLDAGVAALVQQDKTTEINYLVIQGDLHIRTGRFDAAQAAFEQALEISATLESSNNQAMLLADLSQAYIARGEYERARALCQQSIEKNRDLHNRWGESYGLLLLGRAYLGLNDLEQAATCFGQGLQICESTGIKTTLIALLRQQAKVNLLRGDFKGAAEQLSQALNISLENRITPLTLDVLMGYAELDQAQGMRDAAVAIAGGVAGHPAATFETRQQAQLLTGSQPVAYAADLQALIDIAVV